MAQIEIENMEFYAYHGHFEAEQVVGNRFIVNLSIETDVSQAAVTDELTDTVDYQELYNIIDEEMKKTSKLIENVAHRIMERIKSSYPEIKKAVLKLSKLNPPLKGKTDKVSIVMQY